MDSSFLLPGTTGPQILVRRPAIGTIKVFADGVRLKRSGGSGLRYQVPMPDGTTTELELAGQWMGLRAIANGTQLQLEPRLRRWEMALTFLPIVLPLIGGLLGALVAVGAAAINARVARSGLATPVRAIGMLGVTAMATVLLFGLAVAIAPVPDLKTGMCMNDVGKGEVAIVDPSRTVACSASHESEVVGTAIYEVSGPYPGQSSLGTLGQTPCLDAFRSYVGVDFERSSLEMIVVVPTEIAWAKGDRTIGCVAITGDRSRIRGSVKGTHR